MAQSSAAHPESEPAQLVPPDAVSRIGKLLRTVSAADLAEVTARLTDLCTPDITYRDPLARALGVDAVAAHLDYLRRVQLGRRLTLASGLDVVHEYARFGWKLADPAGRPQFDGICVVRFAASGLVGDILAFIGPPPPLQFRITGGIR
ncbi:nuclear transport factor 2 family protein [Yinghuangia soli]|uniref:Nuclear transport factor 2 family protein n=1 Tax=Yinghuangia soli TaxID=2908204 RepID=A0AA41PUX4_9ACTN|nr:nuclear transport factor 2 family protein [Yinghuangia soli]MCF2526328.1 nuclear transport factor 2 family protein [Yinghuangia soli]